jgi:hypothetical protein
MSLQTHFVQMAPPVMFVAMCAGPWAGAVVGGDGAWADDAGVAEHRRAQGRARGLHHHVVAGRQIGADRRHPAQHQGKPRRNMLFLLPKFHMLNSPNSAYNARILPRYAE